MSLTDQFTAVEGEVACKVTSLRHSNAVEKLSTEQGRLEARLAQVKRGQEILKANPELLELLEILAERTY
jgi:hypothetical protein